VPIDLESAFFADILEHPADRAARLIYADWLDEHRGDDPRVADRVRFIRAQCAHESTDPGDLAHLRAKLEADTLLAKYQSAWTGGLSGLVRDWTFFGGFVECVQGAPGILVEHGERLCNLIPLRGFSLRQAAGGWGKLVRCNLLGRIEELEIKSSFQGRASWLDQLVATPYLGNLRKLVIERNPLPERAGVRLGQTANLPALEELTLGLASPWGTALADLGTAPLARQLRRLTLSLGWSHVASDAFFAGQWSRLEALQLHRTNISPTIAEGLARMPSLARLRELSFQHCTFDAGSITTILDAPGLGPNLEVLTAHQCNLSARGTPARLPLERWPNLRVLRLGSLGGPLTANALAAHPSLPRLHTLEVAGTSLRGASFDTILTTLERSPLRTLLLGGAILEDAEIRRLAASPALAGIQRLDLSRNSLTDQGAATLLDSPYSAGLLSLRVAGGALISTGCERRVAQRFPFTESHA
jgi:uncharacterized protein (TIGR02996 family)